MTTVLVMLGERSYPIRIRSDSLGDLGGAVLKEVGCDRAVLVTTNRVASAHGAAVLGGFERAQLRCDRLVVPDGEEAKSLDNASRLYDELIELGAAVSKEVGCDRAVLVTTNRVAAAHGAAVLAGFESAELRCDRLLVPDGEEAKSLDHASRLYDELIELGADRQTVIIALGGGATTDLAGFVASTYLRGVPLVKVPTTFLAQVDASVGGKTAVNHPRGKNLIGTFYQPRMVWIDPVVLATLPERERRCGMAEIVKVAAIWDADFFGWLEDHVDEVMRLEPEPLAEAIARACSIKAEVVGLDEREAGLRSLLNFGHTLGHAIEGAESDFLHGEAIAMGMVFAAKLSETKGLAPAGVSRRLSSLLGRVGLPLTPPDWQDRRDSYLQHLAVDKKIRNQKVSFVVLRDIGRAETVRLSPEQILAEGP